jgi:glycosyltransferase involved in cell wall biosynthesis
MNRGSRDERVDALVDDVANRDFADRHGDPVLGPVCVIIAAYREARTLGAVLDEIPARACGLPVVVLVVDDGSDDGTAEVAAAHDAFVCHAPINRGQGAALRLGYRLAARHGADYIVTTDADGQYDPADIPAVLAPILGDEADLVSGSRRLGRTYHGDRFRYLGVIVYAALLQLLVRRRITDPSFGLRAMRVDVATSVELRQPQFQASELLIGAALRGYRTAEVPASMRPRAAGKSRKGNDILYGMRFGRAALSTWMRERNRAQ